MFILLILYLLVEWKFKISFLNMFDVFMFEIFVLNKIVVKLLFFFRFFCI